MPSSSDHKTDPWWDKPRCQAHGTVISTINKLQQQQSYTRERHLANYRMYSDRPVKGFAPGEGRLTDVVAWNPRGDGRRGDHPPVGQADLNGARSAVDTAHAKQVANRMRVQIVTTGGRWDLHTKARGMQRFLDGLWSEAGGHEEQDKQDLDSKIFGSGFLKIVECVKKNKKGKEEGSVTIQCQPSPEFDVDEDSCRTTPPRELFQTKYHASSVLQAKYATKENLKGRKTTVNQLKAEIEEAPRAKGTAEAVITNMVRVVEAIHLPSGPVIRKVSKKTGEETLQTDGRHVICTENATLVDEPWPWPDFGVVKQDWRKLPYEWWGQGIVEEARKLQHYITATIKNNERSHYWGSFPRWVKPSSCDMPDAYIVGPDDEEAPPIWEFDGPSPPVLDAPNPVDAGMMTYPAVLMEWLLNVLGVSSTEAKSDVQGAELSGKALQHISDMSTIRFADKERHKERCGVLSAKVALRLVRDMADRQIKIKAAYRGGPAGSNLDMLDWDKVSLHEEDYRIEPFPTSNLPREPGAKIAYVQQLVQMGWIDPAMAVSLIEMPDLDHATNVKLAAIRHIQWLCDQIVYEGKRAEDLPPDPIMDLPQAIQWARGTWLYAQQMGAPQEVLDRLGAWITDAKNVNKADQKAQLVEQQEMMVLMAPPMPPGGAPPPGGNGGPPTDLGALAGGLPPGAG